VAAIRLPTISSEFDPFIIAIWLRGANAAFGLIIQHFGYNNIVHYNLWFVGEAFLLLWAFEKWNLFESKKFYRFLAVALGFTWLAETILFSKLTGDYNSYFRIIYSFVVILMSISMINNILLRAAINPLKNSIFLICCTLVLLNTITVIGEAFFAYNLIMGEEFRIYMDHIINFIDALCSLIFALIILWMPKKQAFTLQY
jgi:hypothetical protein